MKNGSTTYEGRHRLSVAHLLAAITALYFSMQSLTMITFGDILPVSNIARMMTLVEATVGVFYLAILISRLVGLYSSRQSSDQSPN